jgi:hypothetical protein
MKDQPCMVIMNLVVRRVLALMYKRNMDGSLSNDFSDWVNELEVDPKNENACSIDNPDCEGCGS